MIAESITPNKEEIQGDINLVYDMLESLQRSSSVIEAGEQAIKAIKVLKQIKKKLNSQVTEAIREIEG